MDASNWPGSASWVVGLGQQVREGSMATTAPIQKRQDTKQDELDRLAKDFFELTESQLAKMGSEERERVIASIHATAETCREAPWRL
jgi:hypothetical protein